MKKTGRMGLLSIVLAVSGSTAVAQSMGSPTYIESAPSQSFGRDSIGHRAIMNEILRNNRRDELSNSGILLDIDRDDLSYPNFSTRDRLDLKKEDFKSWKRTPSTGIPRGDDFMPSDPNDPMVEDPSKGGPHLRDATTWKAEDAVGLDSRRAEACSEAYQQLAKSKEAHYPVIRDESSRMTSAGRTYIKTCFTAIDAPSFDRSIRHWVKRRIGLLRLPEEPHQCVMIFLNARLAVSAAHCIEGNPDLKDRLVVSGWDPRSQDDARWEAHGINVLENGKELTPGEVRADMARFDPVLSPNSVRDYAFFAPTSGQWPVDVDKAPFSWKPGADYSGQRLMSFAWVATSELEGNQPTKDWTLMADRSATCVIGLQRSKEFYGVHRCQVVRGSSGTPLVRLEAGPGSTVTGRAFGIHVGPAGSHGDFSISTKANLVISMPENPLGY